MKQIKMRHQSYHSDLDLYCSDDDFSLDRALRDSFDSLPVSHENKIYSFLVNKWGVDLNIFKSNEMLQIILDNLLVSEEKLTRLSKSLDIRHTDDPLIDPELQSDDENKIDDDLFQAWFANLKDEKTLEESAKRKKPLKQKIKPASKKIKITESVPHELTPRREPSSSSSTNGQATSRSCSITDTAETTGAAADETTAVNNDSDDSTTEFDRAMRDGFNHFMNSY